MFQNSCLFRELRRRAMSVVMLSNSGPELVGHNLRWEAAKKLEHPEPEFVTLFGWALVDLQGELRGL